MGSYTTQSHIPPLYKADAAVGSNDVEGRPEMVAYQVTRRFVDNENSVPDAITDMIYYTLAIGHHTGVIDCFEERLRCSLELFSKVLELIPEDSLLTKKLDRAYSRGEAYIDKYDLGPLIEAIDETLVNSEAEIIDSILTDDSPETIVDPLQWLIAFRGLLDVMISNEDASIILRRRGL